MTSASCWAEETKLSITQDLANANKIYENLSYKFIISAFFTRIKLL